MPSYVLGNSPAIATLTAAERQTLDTAEWVFALNHFVPAWRQAGFRPTVWVWGDLDVRLTHDAFEAGLPRGPGRAGAGRAAAARVPRPRKRFVGRGRRGGS